MLYEKHFDNLPHLYKGHLLFIIGSCHQQLLNYQNAVDYLENALNYYNELENLKGIISCQKNLGANAYKKNQYSESFSYFYRALELAEEDHETKASIYVNLGVICYELDQVSDALEYYYLALNSLDKSDIKQHSIILNNLGECYYKLKKYTKALDYFERAIKYFKELNHRHHLAYSYTEASELLIEMSQYERAEAYLNLTRELNRTISSPAINMKYLRNQGLLYLKKNDFRQAEAFTLDALNLSKEYDDLLCQSNCLLQLKNLYQTQKNTEKALLFYEEYHAVNSKLCKMEIQNTMQIMKHRIQIDSLKREKAESDTKNIILNSLNNEILMINQLAKDITCSLDLYEITGYINKIIREMLPASEIALGIYSAETETIHFDYIFHCQKNRAPYSISINDNKQLSALCIKENRALCFQSKKEMDRILNQQSSIPYESAAFIPLTIKNDTLGILTIYSNEACSCSKENFRILSSLSSYLSIAVSNALNHKKIQQLNNQLLDDKNSLQHAYGEIEFLACHDSLTGLANRSLLKEYFARCGSHSQRENRTMALVFIDLDGFKEVNDINGHEMGDKVLIEISRSIQTLVRHSDMLARYGGDEFVLILRDIESEEALNLLLDKIYRAINSKIYIENSIFRLGASIGKALFPKDGESLDQLLKIADNRMYLNKKERKRAKATN